MSKPLMPQTELEQSEAACIKLANAGFRSDSSVSVYLGLRFGTSWPSSVSLAGYIKSRPTVAAVRAISS